MNDIIYYKTYLITYKLPNNDCANYKRAWPAYDDNGKIIWTLCEDNSTIIPNKYIIEYRLL